MNSSDRNLGMDRSISRRDLLLGMGASAAGAFVPGVAFAGEMLRLEDSNGHYDEIYKDDEDERYRFVRGRKPFGRIAIANSDAGSSPLIHVAIDQAYRAVGELV